MFCDKKGLYIEILNSLSWVYCPFEDLFCETNFLQIFCCCCEEQLKKGQSRNVVVLSFLSQPNQNLNLTQLQPELG